MGYIEEIRELVGNQPLILVGTAVGVINDKGEILLQKRRDGSWGVPGGFLDLGESAQEAGRREVLEETGIEIGEMELITVLSGKEYFVTLPNGDQFYPVTIAYMSRDIKGGELKADGNETLEAKFFKQSELPESLNPMIKNMIYSLAR
ncbi:NUDIX hydrolase [Ornithinibacillus californiensis]|uniref:NUDIX hydrolase n=1 Tax=Ornithinibacillus californiensis TaxID=161536 RepID=UPI00064DBC87|nr:NUDIX hydrolase [Ornithinibacillus californiensis]